MNRGASRGAIDELQPLQRFPLHDPEDMIGQTIEGYRVHKQLGPLPLGSRFEVHHPERGAAVLYVLDGAPPLPPVAARRLCGLHHRNLCRVLHVGQLDTGGGDSPPYLIEEQVVGEALRDRVLRRGPLPPKEALWALGQVVAGLSALHQAGFPHRNLSLSALVMAPVGSEGAGGDERVVLVDLLAVPDVPGRDIAEDLQRLGGVFLKLLGHAVPGYVGPASVTAHVLQDLRRVLETEAPGRGPRSALEIYAGVEAAVRRSGLTTEEESALLSDLNGLMALTQQMPSTMSPAVAPRLSSPGGPRSSNPQQVPVSRSSMDRGAFGPARSDPGGPRPQAQAQPVPSGPHQQPRLMPPKTPMAPAQGVAPVALKPSMAHSEAERRPSTAHSEAERRPSTAHSEAERRPSMAMETVQPAPATSRPSVAMPTVQSAPVPAPVLGPATSRPSMAMQTVQPAPVPAPVLGPATSRPSMAMQTVQPAPATSRPSMAMPTIRPAAVEIAGMAGAQRGAAPSEAAPGLPQSSSSKDSATIAMTRADVSRHTGEEEPATIEMERMDPAELLSFLPAAGLANVKGPLEGRAGLPGVTAPEDQDSNPDSETRPAEKADPEVVGAKAPTQQRTQKTGRLWQRLASGPLLWLFPLGLCTVITLLLAAWVLWHHPPQRP